MVLDECGIGMKVVLDDIFTFGMKVVLALFILLFRFTCAWTLQDHIPQDVF